MKEKILKNWGFKILALLLGFVLWFFVANIEDYSVTKTISGIPVQVLNEDAITSQDKVYEVEQGSTVSVEVRGRRSIVENLTVDDFQATADLSELSITNSVQISVEVVRAAIRRELEITASESMMKVAIEDSGEQKLPVTVKTNGLPQDEYAVISTSATPNVVTITGAASSVKKITEVRVELDIDGLNSGVSTRGNIILLDSYGEVVRSDKIKTSVSTVSVRADIKKTKEVPIIVQSVGEVAEGYAVSGSIEQSQNMVLIAGDDSVIRSVHSILINDIDITDLESSYEGTVDINDYLPDGIVVADSTKDITIRVPIEALQERVLTIRAINITMEGQAEVFEYSLPTEENEFEVTITGLKADIENVNVADLKPTIDVSEFTREGIYRAAIELQELERVDYNANIYATVEIVKIEEETTEEDADSSSTSGRNVTSTGRTSTGSTERSSSNSTERSSGGSTEDSTSNTVE